MRPVPAKAVAFIKDWEKFRSVAYKPLPTDPWTIGYGFTVGVKEGDQMTKSEAEMRLLRELAEYQRQILAVCKIEPNDAQLSAMLSLAYNIGMGWRGTTRPRGAKNGFRQSTVLAAHNRGDFKAASRAFGLWIKSGGKETLGLVRRRAAESALYLEGVDSATEVETPITVDEEKPLTQSTTVGAGTITAAASGLSVASQMAGDVASIKYSMGEWMPYLVLGCAIVAALCGIYVVYERYRNRQRGLN